MNEVRARGRIAGIVSALLLFWAVPAGAQVTAAGSQNLAFGVLVPGAPGAVSVTDGVRRGEWVLTGRGNATIALVLPAALVAASGASIPLVFGTADAAWQRSTGGLLQTVDPATPFSVNVPNRQAIRIFLGGTAQPSVDQSAGVYSATITLIVAQP